MSTITRRRTAHKTHHCSWGSCRTIQAGEVYLVHTEFPGGESGYADSAGHPVNIAECSDCATRHDRADQLVAAS